MKIILIGLTVLSVFQLGYGNYSVREEIRNSINFSFDLYKIFFDYENAVFSPLSFRVLLSLVYQGAIHQTFDDIRHKLYLSDDKGETYRTQTENFDRIFSSSNIKLANKIYIREGDALKSDFLNAVRGFNSDIEQVNFHQPIDVASNINNWVEEKTNGLIRDLVNPSEVTRDTALFLLNSIYFKAKWEHPFDQEYVSTQQFRGRYLTKDISFIADQDYYKVSKISANLVADVLEIPYQAGSNFVFWIILPQEYENIQQVVGSLNDQVIHRINSTFVERPYRIKIPQFEIETGINAKELFTNFGIGSLFNNAELDVLENEQPLQTDEMKQKTKIVVNTDGTEAVTSTISRGRKIAKFPSFDADRPFIFAVLTADELEPVFLGHYINPV